jgi:hypothetical protein
MYLNCILQIAILEIFEVLFLQVIMSYDFPDQTPRLPYSGLTKHNHLF